eukprot:COSAG02_NODE_2448_length_8837_cov_38.266880_3_plen_68_part_00
MTDPRVTVTAAEGTRTVLTVLAKHSPIHAGMNQVQQVALVVHLQEEGDGKLVVRRRMIKMRTGIGGE